MSPYLDSRNERGFTLLETLLVLVIISIALALAPPLISKTSGIESKASARKIASSFKYARNKAIRERTAYSVEARGTSVIIAPLKDGNGEKEIRMPGGFTIEASEKVIFYPGGDSSGGAFRLLGEKDRPLFTITAEPSTGRATIDAEKR